jgi:hypothetical protein
VLADTEAANPNEISELVRIEVFFMEVEVILRLDDDFAQKWMEVNDFLGNFKNTTHFLINKAILSISISNFSRAMYEIFAQNPEGIRELL